MERGFKVGLYRKYILDDQIRNDGFGFCERLLIRDLPRRFHQLTHELQIEALKDYVPLTGHAKWDALLAAVVEHIAILHNHRPPDWTQEPQRFLELPWVIPSFPSIARRAVLGASAVFIKHGVFPDPWEFDKRGGELHEWR